MKVAVIGSRTICINNLGDYLPKECTEILSDGAKGVDECAAIYATDNSLKLTVFLPEYDKYGRKAPIVRNKQIVDYSDAVLAFWYGKSEETLFVIRYCENVKNTA